MENTQKYMRVGEAAKFLNVSESTIRRLATRGELTKVKVGSRIALLLSDEVKNLAK